MMTNEQITKTFMEKGWEIRYRGGNSMCTTPSDLDVIVADMPRPVGRENSTPWLESPPRYSIAAFTSGNTLHARQEPVFNLYDAERGVTVGVRRVPTPQRAAELLGRYGVPESDTYGTAEPAMVPEAAQSAYRPE